ncbi:precorrin-6Y C5,15-methyltransferase (decarboxylating) subunit CbiT [Actibacterium pelagium]|uniref:Precorrin-6Y methyltransferase n=1 Tax=Actibacterium pelagium TaxID=2029103 RepID=A0A917EMK0_9RHOB|nr:precorrin-6Y C5,15-methyltransferase (decarboxylating) subunit CbiT [Actibacterium pelagium]GGE60765.1 precorrin-6Y methyltransferase [Actibacterium pelagium]
MSDPWVTIIGLTESGKADLGVAAIEAIENADLVIGGARHLELVAAGDKGQPWPIPFAITPVLEARGKQVVVLASSDPFWFGAGSTLADALKPGEWTAIPAPSTFALATSTLGWRLEETLCMGLHAAPFEQLTPVLCPGQKIIATVRDGAAVGELASWLTANGFGPSTLHVLEALGGPRQNVRAAKAQTFDLKDVQAPVSVAITPAGSKGLPRASGLDNDYFAHDGQITKQAVRAMTLSALAPSPGQVLWDLGAGSGSISVEWCLSAPRTRAYAVERREDRAVNIRQNIQRFGLGHRMELTVSPSIEALADLPDPDAVFIGGGANKDLLSALWDRLPAGTRLVVNGVTLDTETLLAEWHAAKGGHLLRVELSEVQPLGSMRGWTPARPVTQWSVTT